jgi:hypothetical protein
VLTLLGSTEQDGVVYTLECRADRADPTRACARWEHCAHSGDPGGAEHGETFPCVHGGEHRWNGVDWTRPGRGCRLLDEDDLYDLIYDVSSANAHEESLGRGVYLVGWVDDDRDGEAVLTRLTVLAQIGTSIPWPSLGGMAAIPTTATRYPGFGLEADVRELIEEALCDPDGEALSWEDMGGRLVVDANDAAHRVVRYFAEPVARTDLDRLYPLNPGPSRGIVADSPPPWNALTQTAYDLGMKALNSPPPDPYPGRPIIVVDPRGLV